MKIEILIASFCRPEYLQWNLWTLAGQLLNKWDYQITVLNDGVKDETINVVSEYRNQGIRVNYLFTGQRNQAGLKWRCPGYALNIGIQQSRADTVILTCAEMYHLNDSVNAVIKPVYDNSNNLGTPHKVHEDKGELIHALNNGLPVELAIAKAKIFEPYPFVPNPYMPYFMAINRQKLLDIGGYDEDFTGKASDDNDLMERLLATGCQYAFTPAEVIHLFHGQQTSELLNSSAYLYNRKLMIERRNCNVRNEGRKWGVL